MVRAMVRATAMVKAKVMARATANSLGPHLNRPYQIPVEYPSNTSQMTHLPCGNYYYLNLFESFALFELPLYKKY